MGVGSRQPACRVRRAACAAAMRSPIGEIVVIARDGAVECVRFVDATLNDSSASGPWSFDDGSREVCEAVAQLRSYFAGELSVFDLPLAPWGGRFQSRVLEEVRSIPFGRTRTYGEIARRIGNEGASRAVGATNGRNPWPIVVPCHRVVGSGGRLTGYGGGLWRKEWLLGHEGGAFLLARDSARA
ncbi:MAG: methylated-DNA--[protein]-cysteine S-methyltransferase [Phycisphaeraceae bacterium]|nr:methylated-DNA--[protein]-cysteine S-methyltransferase [Phycisphaeraceae bacterium]